MPSSEGPINDTIMPSHVSETDISMQSMRLEVTEACHFLIRLIRMANSSVSESRLDHLSSVLLHLMMSHYRDHWFLENPIRGSGYRCIRIDGKMDPLIGRALEACGLSSDILHSNFPLDFTLWIDPGDVSYRMGERGGICTLYKQQETEIKRTEKVNRQEEGVSDIAPPAQKKAGMNCLISWTTYPSLGMTLA